MKNNVISSVTSMQITAFLRDRPIDMYVSDPKGLGTIATYDLLTRIKDAFPDKGIQIRYPEQEKTLTDINTEESPSSDTATDPLYKDIATNPITNLTLEQEEKLHYLIETCSSVIKVTAKALLHGFESKDPVKEDSLTNKQEMQREVQNLVTSLIRLSGHEDLDFRLTDGIFKSADNWNTKKDWFHFQKG